ncbi:MAG TPA: hypothetical protein VFZ09_12895 [Archangium sp.]|uniref:hypothetical protein n=1 Tax=Archangium sp. TaxID=1872627 RepID=UPI002E32089A|nr:hypothetical protein [Archangium sp.]HEX5747133.1 hypothetical protein [Archangium sp.]
MKTEEFLADASQFTSPRWRAARTRGRAEEKELWDYLYELPSFIRETGQVYRFEEHLEGLPPTTRPSPSAALHARTKGSARQAMELLLKVWDKTAEPGQRQPVLVLIGLLDFIADTGQADAFDDYVKNRLEYAPLAMACFATRDEAETWLKGLAEPPSPARIIIGDAYHWLWSSREDDTRAITRDYVIEPYLEALTARGIPPAVPAFESREDAAAWLSNHPMSPFGFVSIAGESHLAVHHKRLKRHTLHPVASALSEWEEEKKRRAGG